MAFKLFPLAKNMDAPSSQRSKLQMDVNIQSRVPHLSTCRELEMPMKKLAMIIFFNLCFASLAVSDEATKDWTGWHVGL